MSSIYIPVQEGLEPDANYLLRDLEFQFMRMVREESAIGNWHTRFAWMPPNAFPSLNVDLPIDLSSFAFGPWTGTPTFRGSVNTKMRVTVDPFWEGAYVDTRALRDPNAYELLNWNGRAQNLMSAWNRHLPPKIYDLLQAGETVGDAHPVTGSTKFFNTGHYYNVKFPDYGTFDNIIGGGGALAASPIYAVLEGGSLSSMKPWGIFRGSGPVDSIKAAGGSVGGAPGMPWVVKWDITSDKVALEQNWQARIGVYAERGYKLLFPHTCIRFEGTLDYAGLVSIVDNAGGRKDLNGFMNASQTRVSAFLVQTAAQRTTINGILGREITDTASTGVKVDERLKAVEVIVMDR